MDKGTCHQQKRRCSPLWSTVAYNYGSEGRGLTVPGLRIVPVDRDDAKAFTRMWHRHHGHVLPASHRFSQGVADEDDFLLGVAITEAVYRFLGCAAKFSDLGGEAC